MSCSKSLKKKYTSRPAPPYPAQNCKNIIKTGNNGKKYKSVSNKNGIYKWKLIQSKRTSTKSYKKMNKFTVDYAAKNINKLITIYCREYKDEEPKKSDWIQNKCGTHYKLKFRPNGNAGIEGKKQRIENWLISQKPPIKNRTLFVLDGELYYYENNKWMLDSDTQPFRVDSRGKQNLSVNLLNTECFIIP
jgi:glutathione peroxidase-family protein